MRFIAFDLETTGILPGVDRIVEIGAVRFIGRQVESIFSTLVDPEISIPEGASRINGITDDMVLGKPKIQDLLASFAEFCGNDLIVAHNAPFDSQFLTADIKKHEAQAPKGTVLCTFQLAKKILPGLPNYKLGTVVQHLDIPSSQFHRAEEDATYCGHVFIRMMEKLTGELSMPPIENLLALTGKTKFSFPQIIPQPKQMSLLDQL